MAAPDVTGLTSSAQIFSGKYTLPQIRSIHKALHVQIDEKSSRLRTQVGGSYRELLGTADTIVQMHGHNDEVQDLLADMGGRCGRAIVDSKASALASFVTKTRSRATTEAARLRLLDACVLVAGRVLKGGGGLDSSATKGDRLVLAAKILVLSRLLVKSLADDVSDDAGRRTADTATKALGNMRRRLLRGIEKVLEEADEKTDRGEALQALCAYSLATSSGAKDVLRQFLHVRGQAMALAFDDEGTEKDRKTEDVVRSLQLYTRTLLDVQALIPAKLSQALSALKRRPLLEDAAIKQLEGLRLDIYAKWCGEEIRYFTPFIRHDDIDGKLARDMLFSWAERGGEVLLESVRKTLQNMGDFKSIMDLRTSVLRLWIRNGGRAKGFDPQEMQDDLREAINARMLVVLEAKVSKLRLVGSEINATLEAWHPGITDQHASLWSEDGYDAALASGAAPFIQEVVSRLHGRNDAVSKAIHSYTSWFHVIDDVKEIVESLKKQRWDNDYDEVEDEDTIEARQQILSREDPAMLQNKLDSTLDKSFKELDQQVQKLWDERADAAESSAIAMYLLRVLRDIRSQLPARPAIKSFGLGLVPALHIQVATRAATSPLDDFARALSAERKAITRPLWEGEPALPGQPSPTVFRFLRGLSVSMEDAGVDLWSPAATQVLKEQLSERLCEIVRGAFAQTHETSGTAEAVATDPEAHQNEEEKPGDKDAASDGKEEKTLSAEETATAANLTKELHVQWFFDLCLLQGSIGNASETARGRLHELCDEVGEHAGLDDASRQRIAKSAQDFWQRTRLLFGLLS
ncbi:hypothetical protein S40288_02822 [Stachybotrys chartarum IBT 40288]|nr:hypothetical protein S40288_02822 [Stachybotrys chartarum IBT 40288]